MRTALSRRALARLSVLLLGVITLLGIATACASPDDESGDGNGPTVTDHLGSVTVPQSAQRVVTLGWQETDTALALGFQPVGIAQFPFAEDGIAPWQRDKLTGTPEKFSTAKGGFETVDLPIEAIAALNPDLIIATTFADYETYRDRLQDIAPTVGPARRDYQAISWQDQARQVGRALNKEGAVDGLVDGVEQQLADSAAAHPKLNGVTYTIGIALPTFYKAVNKQDDFSTIILGQYGMRHSDRVRALPDTGDGSGAATISLENADQLDADVLLLSFIGVQGIEQARQNPVFAQIPAVRDNRFVDLDPAAISALRNASPLSIGFAVTNIIEAHIAPTVARR